MSTYDEIVARTDIPAVMINSLAEFEVVNEIFTETYGWTRDDLLGRRVATIIPEHMRNAHVIGFARFMATEEPRILGKPLPLPVLCKNGDIIDATHIIVGKKIAGQWHFAATIEPREAA